MAASVTPLEGGREGASEEIVRERKRERERAVQLDQIAKD